jgi:hypothetical protein
MPAPAPLDLREIGRAAFLVALALVLPVVFHALRLGSVFLPMYLPILAGGFLLRPRWAIASGAAAPLLSAVATGMPPLFPPVAAWMAIELAAMAGLEALLSRRSRLPVPVILAAALLAGRVVYGALAAATALWLDLPAELVTAAALLSGWPGMLLAMAAVPAAVAAVRRRDAGRQGS